MIMSRIAIVLFASALGWGCGHGLGAVEIYSCAKPSTDGSNQPLQTSALVAQGNLYLEGGLRDLTRYTVLDVAATLRQSGDCFGRALRLAPDSYEAHLSMGIAYLARARMQDEDTPDRADLLNGARRLLGRAYMLRHGAFEPLYYLAEVAATQGDLALARRLLEPLHRAGVKEGAVNMLLGSLSERQDKPREARTFYRKAVAAGWPPEALSFAAARLRKLGTDTATDTAPLATVEGR